MEPVKARCIAQPKTKRNLASQSQRVIAIKRQCGIENNSKNGVIKAVYRRSPETGLIAKLVKNMQGAGARIDETAKPSLQKMAKPEALA